MLPLGPQRDLVREMDPLVIHLRTTPRRWVTGAKERTPSSPEGAPPRRGSASSGRSSVESGFREPSGFERGLGPAGARHARGEDQAEGGLGREAPPRWASRA